MDIQNGSKEPILLLIRIESKKIQLYLHETIPYYRPAIQPTLILTLIPKKWRKLQRCFRLSFQ